MVNAKNAKMQNNKLMQSGFLKACVNVEITFEKKTLNKYRVHYYFIIMVLQRKIQYTASDPKLVVCQKEVFC